MLRVEIQFQRLTNPRDHQDRPDLYKVNSLSEDEMIANLATLLVSDSLANDGEDVMFDSEDQVNSQGQRTRSDRGINSKEIPASRSCNCIVAQQKRNIDMVPWVLS